MLSGAQKLVFRYEAGKCGFAGAILPLRGFTIVDVACVKLLSVYLPLTILWLHSLPLRGDWSRPAVCASSTSVPFAASFA